MSPRSGSSPSDKALLLAIGIILAGYLAAAGVYLPQHVTQRMVASGPHGQQSGVPSGTAAAEAPHAAAGHPPYWMAVPFVALLAAIAVLPLVPATRHWWENNLHRFFVAGGLAALTLAYYLLLTLSPSGALAGRTHRAASAGVANFAQTGEVLANAILVEYIPFIILLFALYTISGGIRIEGDLPAHPLTNCTILAAGGRLGQSHGHDRRGNAADPPSPGDQPPAEARPPHGRILHFHRLQLRRLPLAVGRSAAAAWDTCMGVPFLWTVVLWKEWLFVNAALVAIYYVWDRFWCYPRERPATSPAMRAACIACGSTAFGPMRSFCAAWSCRWRCWTPARPCRAPVGIPGPICARRSSWPGRLVAGLGRGHARRANRFSMPRSWRWPCCSSAFSSACSRRWRFSASKGPKLGLTEPWQFFWATGGLSSVLDNAPTYVVFFETAKSLSEQNGLTPAVAGVAERLLVAISLGSVFMGAMTYIGNGPNFMVKAVAERFGVKMPGFFAYLLYSVAVLLPLFVLTTFLFLRSPSQTRSSIRCNTTTSPPRASCGSIARKLAQAKTIALDTEFVSEHTYRPVLCLIQVAADGELAVIDAGDDRRRNAVLGGRGRRGARNDRSRRAERDRVLPAGGRAAASPADRRADCRGAGGSGVSGRPGHAGFEIPCPHAAEARDPHRLAPPPAVEAADRIRAERRPIPPAAAGRNFCDLEELGRLGWLQEEMDAWQKAVDRSLAHERWRRVSGNASLNARELAIVRELFLWRDAEARHRDQPVRRILRDDLIIELARRGSADPKRIQAVRGMERGRPAAAAARDLPPRSAGGSICPRPNARPGPSASTCRNCPFWANSSSPPWAASAASRSLRRTWSARPTTSASGWPTARAKVRTLDREPPQLARGWRAEFVGRLFEDLLDAKLSVRVGNPKSDHPLVFEPLDSESEKYAPARPRVGPA